MEDVRRRIASVVWDTQNLDWLFLTKRIENAKEMLYRMWFADAEWPKNYWLGTTVENQEQADKRIPILLNTPAKVRFLSVEPLLGPVDISKHLRKCEQCGGAGEYKVKHANGSATFVCPCHGSSNTITWVIIGGESGPKARPCDLAWIRSIVKQCKAAGVPCFVKQLGSKPYDSDAAKEVPGANDHVDPNNVTVADVFAFEMIMESMAVCLKDSHGGDPSEWPEDLRVHEFPTIS